MSYDYLIGDLVMDGTAPYEFGIIIDVCEHSEGLALHIKWNNKISVCSPYRITPVKSIDGYPKD